MGVEGGNPQRRVFSWPKRMLYLISIRSSNCVLAVDSSDVTVDSRGVGREEPVREEGI